MCKVVKMKLLYHDSVQVCWIETKKKRIHVRMYDIILYGLGKTFLPHYLIQVTRTFHFSPIFPLTAEVKLR